MPAANLCRVAVVMCQQRGDSDWAAEDKFYKP